MKALLAVVCLVALAWFVSPPHEAPSPPAVAAGTPAEIVTAFDGDTLLVLVDGNREKVRLVGIDTPEVKGPHTAEERCGPEASRRTKELARSGDMVRLYFEGESLHDQYGRLLARLVLADGRDLNELLLTEGLAERFRKYGYRKEEYSRLEAEAKRAGVGLWGKGKACASSRAP